MPGGGSRLIQLPNAATIALVAMAVRFGFAIGRRRFARSHN